MAEGLYRVTLTQLLYGQQLQNVLNLHGPSPADTFNMSLCANEVETIWVNQMRTVQIDNLRYVSIKVVALGSPIAPFIKTVSIPGTAGQNSNAELSQSFCVRLLTNHAGRRGRGRVFIGGIFANNFDQGLSTTNAQTALNTRFANILGNTGFDSSVFKLQVTNRTGDVFFAVTSMQLAPTPGSQRRRKVGRGI